MNITEMKTHISKDVGLNKEDAKAALTAFMEGIKAALVNGDRVSLKGFGTFEVKDTKEKTARNPRTGETMTIPAGKRVKFTASDSLKDAVKGNGGK